MKQKISHIQQRNYTFLSQMPCVDRHHGCLDYRKWDEWGCQWMAQLEVDHVIIIIIIVIIHYTTYITVKENVYAKEKKYIL